MRREKKPALVIAFDATAQALAAEALFQEKGLPGRMIPIPAQVSAGCGLAWKAEVSQEQLLLHALDQAEIVYSACCVVELFG